jgi:UDP-2-acetamido-3-amino-2,3-dideoxy-glucuronate N-acetyltransferase
MTKIAVVGCGRWGKNLVRNFYELGVLSHVCDTDLKQLESVCAPLSDVKAVHDFQQLLHEDDITGLVIATKAEQHAVMAEAALRAGKDVFVEKPLALRYQDGERLVQMAATLNRILLVGHLLEYHPAILKLQELIQSGELGKLQYIYSNRLNLGRVRSEENILWSFAPHDIAVLLRLIGDAPLEVTATGGAYLQPNIADVTVTSLLFDHGVRAHIFVSWLHPYKEHRLVVIGSKQMAVFNDTREHKLMLYDHGINMVDGVPITRANATRIVEFDNTEPLKLECQHFLYCIKNRTQPRTHGLSGLAVLHVLQAAQRSLQTGGQPVQPHIHRLEIMTL